MIMKVIVFWDYIGVPLFWEITIYQIVPAWLNCRSVINSQSKGQLKIGLPNPTARGQTQLKSEIESGLKYAED